MSNLRFEIYPAATPTSGLLATFNSDDYEEGTELRQELNGTGSGRIVVHSAHADVTAANFARGNYVKVIDLDLGAGEAVGGFFLTEGDFVAVSRREEAGRILTFGGPGALGYFSRASMDSGPYVPSGTGVYNGARDDMLWHWGQHTDLTFDKIGAILKRVIDEFQHADRPTDPIPDLTYDFDNDLDSAGTPWDDLEPGGFTIAVGQGGLSIIEQFMRTGITILAHPDLLLQAFTDEYGTDRSSATFAAGKVRFEHGTNIVVGTAGDTKQAIHETPRVRRLLVAGDGATPATVVTVTDAGEPLEKEGFLRTTGSGVTYLTELGERDLALRAAATSTAILTTKPGDDEANGFYTPGWPGGVGHYWLGDSVTLHTGTAAYDFNEAPLRVAAIHYKLRAAGDWEIVLELGSTYYSISQPKIPGITAPGGGCVCPHPPSGPYGGGEVSEFLWTFDANNKDTTDTYPVGSMATHWHPGMVHTHVLSPSVGNFSEVTKPPISPGDYRIRAIIRRGTETYNPSGITFTVWSFDNGIDTELWTSDPVTSLVATEVGTVLTFPAGADHFAFQLNNNASELLEVELLSGGSGDVFAGDSPPPAADDSVGDLGDDIGCYALCDHKHPAQSAGVTPISDAGGYFQGANVEEALQELAASVGGESDTHGTFLASFHTDDEEQMDLLASTDGITFTTIVSDLLASSHIVRDPSIIHWDGAYWIVATYPGSTNFRIYTTPDLSVTPWTETVTYTDGTNTNTWAPEWVRNLDGTPFLHPSTGFPCIMFARSTDSETTFVIREVHPTNRGMTAVSTAVTVTGTGLPTRMIDPFCLTDGETFYLWYKDEANKHIEYATSTTALTSGYTVTEDGDWASWNANKDAGANSIEGPCVIRLDDGRWRIYFNENNGLSSIRTVYSDSTDVAGNGPGGAWGTWTTQAELVTTVQYGHGSVVFIPGMYDHMRDPDAHDAILESHEAAVNPHPGYATDADLVAHEDDPDPHPGYATDADVAAVTSLLTVDPGTVTYDDTGPDVEITVDTVWGFDGTDPYYDSTGAAAGEWAILAIDPDTGEYAVVPYEVP